MKTQKIDFSKLLGDFYRLEVKMMVLDWMLKTGKKHRQSTGRWNVDGVNKFLFDYSANDHDAEVSIPKKPHNYSSFFDAVFARAIFKKPNKPINEWRESENIFPNKYRMLKREDIFKGTEKHFYLGWLLNDLFELKGKELNKKVAHPSYLGRTIPKIIGVKIYTYGQGWRLKYQFSFSEFDYKPGWLCDFYQNENEPIAEFFLRTYNEISNKHLLKSELQFS